MDRDEARVRADTVNLAVARSASVTGRPMLPVA